MSCTENSQLCGQTAYKKIIFFDNYAVKWRSRRGRGQLLSLNFSLWENFLLRKTSAAREFSLSNSETWLDSAGKFWSAISLCRLQTNVLYEQISDYFSTYAIWEFKLSTFNTNFAVGKLQPSVEKLQLFKPTTPLTSWIVCVRRSLRTAASDKMWLLKSLFTVLTRILKHRETE